MRAPLIAVSASLRGEAGPRLVAADEAGGAVDEVAVRLVRRRDAARELLGLAPAAAAARRVTLAHAVLLVAREPLTPDANRGGGAARLDADLAAATADDARGLLARERRAPNAVRRVEGEAVLAD